jgi:CheY-like chemotaxis protein
MRLSPWLDQGDSRDHRTMWEGGVRVLLVDDQEPFLRAMSAVVGETTGWVVVGEAASGERALTLAAELLPDLVLMDVHLPGIDGVTATRALRAGDPTPVVILLSTHDEDTGDGFVAESGASAYLTKSALSPARLTELWEAAASERTGDGPPHAGRPGA